MKRAWVFASLSTAALLAAAAAGPVLAVEQVPARQVARAPVARAPGMDVDVWINKDEGGVYRPGESMTIYFRSSADAYVLVFNVDTDGYIHLIYPYGPSDPTYVDAGRTYRIPSRSDPYDLAADGPPGVEYVVAVASPVPFHNLPWYLSREMAESRRPEYESEDDGDPTDAGTIVGDPYVGIDRIVRRIVPPGQEDRIATSETYFYIERRVEYPRYLCADCHFHPYFFDPYVTTCSIFEVRIDATWARYAPIRVGVVRPRYIYRVRPSAPPRYRQWKEQWSSLDGRTMLRTRFLPERKSEIRRGRTPSQRQVPPEFRDLRRYRPGRFWKGRDEVLRVRDRRGDRSREQLQRNPEQPRSPREERREEKGRVQERERPQSEDEGKVKERGRPQGGDEGKVKERERPPEREDRGSKEREQRPTPEERKERNKERERSGRR